MPAIERYSKRLRAIKEINRMISELNNTKAQWENSPFAARNNQLYQRWTTQIKKLNRYVEALALSYSKIFNFFLYINFKFLTDQKFAVISD